MLHILICVVEVKLFTFYIENAELQCCCGAVDPSASHN